MGVDAAKDDSACDFRSIKLRKYTRPNPRGGCGSPPVGSARAQEKGTRSQHIKSPLLLS